MMTNAFVESESESNPARSNTTHAQEPAIRKVRETLAPGRSSYEIRHDLGTEDVIVQTRIAGRIREGGISILDENTVRVIFGGTLNEPMDVVIIG